MSAQASGVAQISRPLADFHPDVWGYRFLLYPMESLETDIGMENQAERLREEVKRMMIAAAGNPSRILNLIDVIQRLGLCYHFEGEIDKALHEVLDTKTDEHKDDLYMSALRFRLVRQHGFYVSSDIFENFMDEKGHFKEDITEDVRAVLSLYEASYLRVHGEDILEEALAFTTTCLESKVSHLSPPLSVQVRMALTRPIRRSLPRLLSRQSISIYEEDASHDKVLLAFAKIDFNRLQKLHQKELGDISRWDMGCIDMLPDYVKPFYGELVDVYEEFERELSKHGRSDCVHYAKEEIKKLVRAYLVDAKWLSQNYTPTMDEYMSNALVTVGYSMLSITSFLGMCDTATRDVFEYWSSNDLKIVRAASVIARLMDDISSHEFEQQRVHIASAMECYMKENSVSKQQAIQVFHQQIEDAWKDVNKALLTPDNGYMPMPLLNRVLNLTRMIDIIYKDGRDELTRVGEVMKSSVTALFIDPVPV